MSSVFSSDIQKQVKDLNMTEGFVETAIGNCQGLSPDVLACIVLVTASVLHPIELVDLTEDSSIEIVDLTQEDPIPPASISKQAKKKPLKCKKSAKRKKPSGRLIKLTKHFELVKPTKPLYWSPHNCEADWETIAL